MTTIADFKDELFNWATTVTSRTVIFQNVGEGPILNEPHITLFVLGFENAGIPATSLNQTTNELVVTTDTELRVIINVFWGDVLDAAKRLTNSLWVGNRVADLYKVSGLGAVGETLDLTFIDNGAFKPRAQLEVAFWVSLEYTEPIDFFVEAEAEVNGETITAQDIS